MKEHSPKDEFNSLQFCCGEFNSLFLYVVKDEGKVIYINPYAGDSYELPADLILVTHSHFDHNQTDKVEKRNEGCQIIKYKDAVKNGEHQVFELGFVTVKAVEA